MSVEKIQPVNGNALIRLEETEGDKKIGGIIIPRNAQEKLHEGIVEGLAAGATDEISIGDRVIYKEFSGTKIKHGDTEYLIIPVDDIIAKYVDVDEI